MIKKTALLVFLFFALFSPSKIRAEETVNIYFFWSKSCPHCTRERVFLEETVVPRYSNVKLQDFEVSNRENTQFLLELGEKMKIETGGVPIVIIGDSHIVGYLDDDTTGKRIVSLIEENMAEGYPDPVGTIIDGSWEDVPVEREEANEDDSEININKENPTTVVQDPPVEITLPFVGKLDVKRISLPLLTLLVAAMDGFNPCAMWTLLFLISLLLGMKDRRRMFILGSAFIVSSAFVYFLFLSAWLNLFLFLGFVFWVRIGIGVLAVAAGIYYLRDYIKNKSGGCNVMGNEKRQKVFERIRNIAQRKEFLLALIGIIILAFAVNLVELICSAGLPAVYTQVLSMSDLNPWQYYGYLLFYVLIFMLDDLFIFFTAMLTLQATGIQSKYSRFSHLVGGILMLIIGLLLLFKPEILMFS